MFIKYTILIAILMLSGCSSKGDSSYYGDGEPGVKVKKDHYHYDGGDSTTTTYKGKNWSGYSNSYKNSGGGTYQNPRYQNIATICATQFGSCGLMNRVSVGSPCVCPGPYGPVQGMSK